MKITYILPSRSRREKFFKTLNNIQSLSAKDNYLIIASLDLDDFEMNNDEVKNMIGAYKNVTPVFGLSKGKVDAINRDLSFIADDSDIIILVSDDMAFTSFGFDDIIRNDMQKYFPDNDGVLHYPDGSPVTNHVITLSILGYKYFKRFNYLYNPAYTSLWCDMEFTEVAKKLGKYKHLPGTHIYKHNHPLWINEKYDALMTRNEGFYNIDKDIYFKRLALNFGIKK